MQQARSPYQPKTITPPGETIAGCLAQHGISMDELALYTQQSPQWGEALLKGQAPLTPAIAAQLATLLGVPAEYWLKHEMIYQDSL